MTILGKKQMSEEDIKLNYITPVILDGWKGHVTMETKITDGRINISGNIVARSANLMLRALGLSMYLACLGLDAGAHFFDTVFRSEGLLWIGLGAGLTIIPTVLVGFVAFKMMKIDFGTVSGMLCGSMANPMALNYANDTIPGDNPSVAYATVYPLCMFLRVIIAQVLLMFLLG